MTDPVIIGDATLYLGDAKFAAETICEVASPKWKEGSFEFDALTVARAYLELCGVLAKERTTND